MTRAIREARAALKAELEREIPSVPALRAAMAALERAERRAAQRRERRAIDEAVTRLLGELVDLAARAHGRRRRLPSHATAMRLLGDAERAVKALVRLEVPR